jgi:hypothetical protein
MSSIEETDFAVIFLRICLEAAMARARPYAPDLALRDAANDLSKETILCRAALAMAAHHDEERKRLLIVSHAAHRMRIRAILAQDLLGDDIAYLDEHALLR